MVYNFSTKLPANLCIVQLNTARSNNILLSLFSSFSKESPPAIVAIQEPFLFKNFPLNVPAYTLVAPTPPTNSKIRVCFYILKSWEVTISFTPLSFNSGDLFGISVTFQPTLFGACFSSLSLYNVYNARVDAKTRSVSPVLLF